MLRIKKNDTVVVLTGRDRGKKGSVIEVIPEKNLVKVTGIAMLTKHKKPRRQGETGGIIKMEGYIHLSNVMLISPHDAKPCRVNFKVQENGTKVRVCNRTKQEI